MSRHVHERNGIAADDTDSEVIGHVAETFPEATAEIVALVVEQTSNSDGQWNVEVGGDALFSQEQGVSAADTPERFVPDQNQQEALETAQIVLNKSGAAAASDNYTVTVITNDGR
jgi:hypothetical protein